MILIVCFKKLMSILVKFNHLEVLEVFNLIIYHECKEMIEISDTRPESCNVKKNAQGESNASICM